MSEMLELAKRIAERAGKNAKVAPELLYAPILWELQDDARSSADSAQPVAYRFNTHGDQRWRVVIDKPVPKAGVTAFDKIEALYLQPTRTQPQSARTESHSPAAMEGEKDTIVNLIHEHVGFEVLLAIESGVLTGVEKAAEAILAELGRRSQAVSAPSDLADAINVGIKACDLYEVAKEDVLRRSHLEQFLTAALAALTRPER